MKGGVLHSSVVRDLEHFAIRPDHHHYIAYIDSFSFNDANYMEYDWIVRQCEYIDGLSERQRHILHAYTTTGSRILNSYIRGTLNEHSIQIHNTPFRSLYTTESSPFLHIPSFIEELEEIIRLSPPLTKTIKVFRGVKDSTHIYNSLHNDTRRFNEFLSTSLYLPSATADSCINGSCCLLEMTLHAGTPCLFAARIARYANEFEILLAPGTLYRVKAPKEKYILDDMDHYESTRIFIDVPDTLRKMTVIEMETL